MNFFHSPFVSFMLLNNHQFYNMFTTNDDFNPILIAFLCLLVIIESVIYNSYEFGQLWLIMSRFNTDKETKSPVVKIPQFYSQKTN